MGRIELIYTCFSLINVGLETRETVVRDTVFQDIIKILGDSALINKKIKTEQLSLLAKVHGIRYNNHAAFCEYACMTLCIKRSFNHA